MVGKEARENQILLIALDEFIYKGYYGTSTREIGKIAGLSSGALFHYFESKDALYHRIIKMGTNRILFNVELARDNPKEYLRKEVEAILDEMKKDVFVAKMFIFMGKAHYEIGISQGARLLLSKSGSFNQCLSIIEMGQKMNQFKKGDPLVLGITFFGALQGIAQLIVHNFDIPLPKAEWLMDIISIRD